MGYPSFDLPFDYAWLGPPGPPTPTPPNTPPQPSPTPRTTPLSAKQLLTYYNALFPFRWVATGQSPVYSAIAYATALVLGFYGDQVLDFGVETIPTASGTLTIPSSQLQTQLRLRNMGAPLLDVAIQDFFGTSLPRLANESDPSYLNRALSLLFQPKNTQPAIQLMLRQLTGQPAHLINPALPADVGGFSGASNPSLTPVGGVMVYRTLLGPPSYLGTDVGAAPLRFANPNGRGTKGLLYGQAPTGTNFGYAWQGFIDTTWPTGFGAQGNPVNGFMTVLHSNPPNEYGATGTLGAPSVYTNISAGGFAACSAGMTVPSFTGNPGQTQSVYSMVVGDPTTALFNSRGLMPSDLASGQATVLSAINKLRAAGTTIWARCLPAQFLYEEGFTS